MKSRIITSLIGVPLIFSVLISFVLMKIFIFLLMIFSLYEIFQMSKLKEKSYIYISSLLILIVFIFSVLFNSKFTETLIGFITLASFMLLIFLIFKNWDLKEKIKSSRYQKNSTYIFFISILYFSLVLIHLILLRNQSEGFKLLIYILVITFSVDTFSYFIGSLIGKRRENFLSLVSPNKTIEGTLGGFLIGFVCSIILSRILEINGDGVTLVIISILIPFFAITGDFLQSGLKRFYGAKDSGGTLPGHGGFLDRIDSLGLSASSYYWILVFI